jgi:hypothetical protein
VAKALGCSSGVTYDAVVLGHLLLGHGLGPGGADGDLVAVPVGEADDRQADEQADDGTRGATEELAEEDQDPAEPGEQDESLERVLHGGECMATSCEHAVSRQS